MREWGEMEMNASAGGFLSASDGYCPTEQLQYYDMLADPLGFPFQDSDLQLLPYSQQQYGGSGSGSGGGGGANLPFHHLYASPSSTSPSSSSSSSSFTSTSQPFHPPYPYSPYCLEVPCNLGGAEAQCGAPGQGTGTAVVVPLGRRSRVGLGGKVRVQDELCVVCGDKASGYHYNALTCEGCKGFFRRSVTKKAVYRCKSGGGCEMDMYMRRKCQDCRLRKCRAVGMLAECLLTEVQCQSKRLRKGVKGRGGGQEEEEGADSRRVSSTSRLPGQAQSDGLSQDQKLTLDRLVEAHRQYRAQDGAHCKVFEWQCMDDGVQSNGASSQLQRLHQFARTLPGFELLDFSDQSALLSGCSLEVMFLLSAQQFCHNPASPSPALQSFNVFTHHWLRTLETKENIHSRTSQNSGPGEDLLGPVLNFFHSMLALRVTEAEYALLAATALLCSDRQALRSGGCVERMQELVLDLLSRVCRDQAKGPCGGPRRFGRLLGRLTELRTLRHNHLLLLRQQP